MIVSFCSYSENVIRSTLEGNLCERLHTCISLEIFVSSEIPDSFLHAFSSLIAAPLKKTGFSEAFNEDSGDEGDEGAKATNYRDVGRVNLLLTQKSAAAERQANKIYSDALEQDPSAFDYDDSYDSFKAPELKAHALSQAVEKDAPVSISLSL